MGKIKNFSHLINSTFDYLTVEKIVLKNNQSVAVCNCLCGNKINVFPYQLKNGSIKSCGCKKREFIKTFTQHHKRKPSNYIDGRTSNELYGTWFQMMQRCYNPKSTYYHRYGKIGITVCDEWHDFNNFAKWSDSVGGRPKGFTIDRIDNQKGYCPSNCRWADNQTQQRNKSTNIYITYHGETKTISDWAKDKNIPLSTLRYRYKSNVPIEHIFDEPNKRCFKNNKVLYCYDLLTNDLIAIYKSPDELPKFVTKKSLYNSISQRNGKYLGKIWMYKDA